MLDRTRRHLRRIRYYSATRAHTPWTRWRDRGFIAAFVLAAPVLLATEAAIHRTSVAASLHGGLARPPGGPLETAPAGEGGRIEWTAAAPYGEFSVYVTERRDGWPLVSVVRRRPVEVQLKVFAGTATWQRVALPPDDPVRRAIERAVLSSSRPLLHRAWREPQGTPATRQWPATISCFFIWWISLTVASTLLVAAGAAIAVLRRRRRVVAARTMRTRGRCGVCGYDLRGLEFNERCPECGSLVE